jgi:ABC-2 type transport system ATP-binding protein
MAELRKDHVQLSSVTFGYRRGRAVLRDVHVTWPIGVNVLLGLNGAGKTTLLRVLSSIHPPDVGAVEICEAGSRFSTPADLRCRLGYQPQSCSWTPRLSVEDFLHYFAWCRKVPPARRGQAVAAVLAQVGLADLRSAQVGALSGGQYRRLLIGQALVHAPRVVVLDEPSAGLDPEQRILLRETIGQLAQDRVVVFSTHVLEDAADIAQRVTVLHEGRIAFDGRPDELAAHGLAADGLKRLEEGFMRVISRGSP